MLDMAQLALDKLWLIAFVLFLVIELITPGVLVSIWFSLGALAAWIAFVLGAEVHIQAVVFVVASLVLLVSVKPILSRCVQKGIVKTNADALIGTHGIVTEAINNIDSVGTVKAGGRLWTARSAGGDTIPEGCEVEIKAIEGVKLMVIRLNGTAEKQSEKQSENGKE